MLAEAARDNPDVRFVGINTQDRSEAAADLLVRTGVTYPQLVDVDAVVPTVRPIVDAVADRGAAAALEYGASFDGVRPDRIRVPSDKLAAALAALDPDIRTALNVAIERARPLAYFAALTIAADDPRRWRFYGDRGIGHQRRDRFFHDRGRRPVVDGVQRRDRRR